MDQKVADHFAEDGVAQANPLCALNIGHFRHEGEWRVDDLRIVEILGERIQLLLE